MDLRQLETLVAIADHGTFSAAARAMYTVQSNVSGHIARLERELGVQLVDRQRGGLTDDGELVVHRARRILHDLAEISSEVASHGDVVHGQVRLGIIGTTARWLLSSLLKALRSTHPGVRPTVHEANTSSLLPRLLSSNIDAAIAHLPIDDPDVEIEPLFAEELHLVAPVGHPLYALETVSLSELAEHPLLLPPPGTSFRRVLDRAASGAGVELRTAAEIDGVRLMTSLAFEGFGAAIVPATAVPRWLEGAFRQVSVPQLPPRHIAWIQRRRPAPAAPTRATLDVLRRVVAAEGPLFAGVSVRATRTDRGDTPASAAMP